MPYSFANQLPDPNYQIGQSGGSLSEGFAGPGFASIKLTNDQKMMVNRTNSQRLLARSVAAQKWKIGITYHPMTRAEFEPVYSFLLRQNGPLTPFFVSLPQYRVPQNASWSTIVTKTFDLSGTQTPVHANDIKTAVTYAAGSRAVKLNIGKHTSAPVAHSAWAYNDSATNPNTPKPGDMVTFENHTKAYLVTHVERHGDYQLASDQPTTAQLKIGVSPALSQSIDAGKIATFSKPKIKVVMPQPLGDYALNTDNLYSFNLKLEEYL